MNQRRQWNGSQTRSLLGVSKVVGGPRASGGQNYALNYGSLQAYKWSMGRNDGGVSDAYFNVGTPSSCPREQSTARSRNDSIPSPSYSYLLCDDCTGPIVSHIFSLVVQRCVKMDAQGYLVHPQAAHGENWDEIIESTETGDSFEGSVISDVLQYVYQHNLTTDHLLNSFSLSHLFGDLIKTTFPESGEDGFTDPKGLTELEVPDILLRENLSLTDPACRLICEASRVPKDDEVQELTQRAQQYTSTKNRKLELPILRSDNDCDLKKFKKEQLARFHVPIKDHRLPLDTPDNDAGEGMDLQASIRLESELFSQKLRGEKLGVTKDALKFLAEQLRVDVTREDLVSYLLGGANYVKVSSSEAPGV